MITLAIRSGNWAMVSGATGTALARMASFASSRSTNGYQKLPTGLILQWGIVSSSADSAGSLNSFPIAFPNGCFNITGSDAGNMCASVGLTAVSASQFRAYGRFNDGSFGQYTTQWFAIGN